MKNFESLSLEALEARLPDPSLLRLVRRMYPDPDARRAELIRAERSLAPQPNPTSILASLRKYKLPQQAWRTVLKRCECAAPEAGWLDLPVPNFEQDIDAAREWLRAQLPGMPSVTGVYLGLDTLNMEDGAGRNVEIGGTSDCDPIQDDTTWLGSRLQYGDGHLIGSLVALSQTYAKPGFSGKGKDYSAFAEYSLFLAYSGIVLGQAIQKLSLDRDLLFIWGFHDGDMFLLARQKNNRCRILYK